MKLLYGLINFHHFYQQNLFRPFSTVHHFYLADHSMKVSIVPLQLLGPPLVSRTALILIGKSFHSKQSGRFITPKTLPFLDTGPHASFCSRELKTKQQQKHCRIRNKSKVNIHGKKEWFTRRVANNHKEKHMLLGRKKLLSIQSCFESPRINHCDQCIMIER